MRQFYHTIYLHRFYSIFVKVTDNVLLKLILALVML